MARFAIRWEQPGARTGCCAADRGAATPGRVATPTATAARPPRPRPASASGSSSKGPATARASGSGRPERVRGGDNGLAHLDELQVPLAGQLLPAAEGLLLVQLRPPHQDPLGPLDGLAILQRLPQFGRLPAQGLE